MITEPIALDKSLNTTGTSSKNIADVVQKGLNDIRNAIEGGSGGGGHIIVDQSGAEMPQEPNMTFKDAHLTDNPTGESTDIEIVKEVSPADYDNTTDEGIIVTDDGNDALIGAVSDDYVEVTGDGSKNIRTLLNELYAKIDRTKLVENTSWIDFGDSVYSLRVITSNALYFERSFGVLGEMYHDTLLLSSSGSDHIGWVINTTGNTRTQYATAEIPTDGKVIPLYYGNRKAVVDLQTTANRCLYDSNTTVKQKIDLINDDIIAVNDLVNLGDISANAGGYTSKALTIPSGYSIIALEAVPSSTAYINGKLMINGDFSGSTAYISYYSFMNLTSQFSSITIRAICKKN